VSLTLTYDATLSRVRIAAAGIPTAAVYATVERSTNQVNWTTVRGGAALTVAAGAVTVDDYEFAPGVANYYRVSPYDTLDRRIGPAINGNPYFEVDAAGWSGSGASVARSTALAHEGVASLLVTPAGGVSAEARVAALLPVTALRSYLVSGWVRSPGGWATGIRVGVNWHDAGAVLLSTLFGATTVIPAGTWVYLSAVVPAPVSATQARLLVNQAGLPAVGNTWHLDEAQLNLLGSTAGPMLTGNVTPVIDRVWIKSIARPFLNRAVIIQDYSDIQRPARAGVFEVVGRSFPVTVSDVRGSRRWTLDILTETPTEADTLDLILSSGDPLYVQVPPDCDVPGGYVTVGDTTERRPARKSVRRIFSLPCTETAPPGPDVHGAPYTWAGVLADYATWADVMAANATWADLMDNIGSPSDVIVP